MSGLSHRNLSKYLSLWIVLLLTHLIPSGAIKEKLIGALSAGVKTVIVPARNRHDVQELPEEVKRGLKIVCVQ